MPEVSRFFGIVIRLHFGDHPPPHFHAIYRNHQAMIAIRSLSVIEGSLPRRALGLVLEWAALHQAELLGGYERAREHQRPSPIEPLE
ncbi:MAG: DUF4160 domain-containing protein [Deltaproteobacteria bacterium]|nr:DUF4160 domain-containing protein [Deltaproteobacteria bacterium]